MAAHDFRTPRLYVEAPLVAGAALPLGRGRANYLINVLRRKTGDPALVLFGEKITPNHHKLARDFVLLDNFYVNADVSEDGLYWTTSAIASDSNQRTWPMEYAGRTYADYGDTLEGARSAPGGASVTRTVCTLWSLNPGACMIARHR